MRKDVASQKDDAIVEKANNSRKSHGNPKLFFFGIAVHDGRVTDGKTEQKIESQVDCNREKYDDSYSVVGVVLFVNHF